MESIVYTHAEQSPDATAVVDGCVKLTYRQLMAKSIHLAQILQTKGITAPEEAVGILLGSGLQQTVAQLAVRLVGGTCVPIEPTLPRQRMVDMLHQVRVQHVVVAEQDSLHLPDLDTTCIDTITTPQPGSPLPHWAFVPSDCSHILFTSGSTGQPKPVQIRGENILHLATKTPVTPLAATDRVAAFNNPGFDLSLFEIWVTLLSGATIVAMPRRTAIDPGAIRSFLERHHVSTIIITAALFEITVFACPSAFRTLRHVLTAGDVANVQAIRRVLHHGPPTCLWNTYGPTECTTLTTMARVGAEDAQRDRISIGSPVGDMEVFLLDEHQSLVCAPGLQGEIYIAGPQQARGYFGRPDETETHFLQRSRCQLGQHSNDTLRLYRTGDLAEWSPDGRLDFCGRCDTQVKHAGFRVELGEIERSLMLHPAVQTATVVRRPPQSPSGSHALIAFVVSADSIIQTDSLMAFARTNLPSYMIPSSFEIVPELPLTLNGKVDRAALLQNHHTRHKPPQITAADTQSTLQAIWSSLLNLPSAPSPTDDFFALGATSLQAAALIALIQNQLHCLVSMDQLFHHPTFAALLQFLHLTTSTSLATNAPDDTQIWTNDVALVDTIPVAPRMSTPIPAWESPSEGRVLLTGATGFVGTHLLHHLLHRPTVQTIACLVRPKHGLDALTRLRHSLNRCDLCPSDDILRKVLPVDGDLTDEHLGLGPPRFRWLANWASVVFHLAAKVNFCEPYDEHRPANVVGTANMLRLAATGRPQGFHYMSSVDAWGPTGFVLGTKEVREDGPLLPHVHALRYDLGYAQSQWTAEQMVRRMRDRGLAVAIYRPGFIIGDSVTGASNPDDFVSRLIVGCIQLGTFPRLTQCLEYGTVDWVVGAVMHIAAAGEGSLGRSYSLVAPDRRVSVTVEGTLRLLQQIGYAVRGVDYEDWARDVARVRTPLAPLLPMVQERVLGRLTRWEASQHTPWYRAEHTVEALKDRLDLRYRPLDAAMLRRFIAFWNRKGFYKVQEPVSK